MAAQSKGQTMPKQRRYLSYLLRLWLTSDDRKQIWRASLESPGSGERQGFASIKELFEFLEMQTGGQDAQAWESETRNEKGGDTATNF